MLSVGSVRDGFKRGDNRSILLEELLKKEVINLIAGGDDGQPDLFVFHGDTPNDPKIRYPEYPEDLLWFFVECKGPDEAIRETQRKFWRAIAERDDIDLGIKRLKLFRALPEGYKYEPKEYGF